MDLETLLNSHGNSGNAQDFFQYGQQLEAEGDLENSATAYDRAFGLDPENVKFKNARQKVLDQLAITEHGIHFRYIPAGSFLMGSEDGEPDEKPVHPVRVGGFWLSETTVNWSQYNQLIDFVSPSSWDYDESWYERQDKDWLKLAYDLMPTEEKAYISVLEDGNPNLADMVMLFSVNDSLLRQYSQSGNPDYLPLDRTKESIKKYYAQFRFDEKPFVGLTNYAVKALCLRLSDTSTTYRLPTEAEWEKAARGGLINAKYAWGNEPPSSNNCDFGEFDRFGILKSKHFPPHDYGLYAMCGSVWEWVGDYYDSKYYEVSPVINPRGPAEGSEYVLRGGSWADDAEAVRVSFRMSYGFGSCANIGFRLCRVKNPTA